MLQTILESGYCATGIHDFDKTSIVVHIHALGANFAVDKFIGTVNVLHKN